ncbi:hypothetical protein [Flindersiella endophytica]
MSRKLWGAAGAVVAVLAAALLADVLLPPATAGQPVTLYVDRRIGSDDAAGRLPDQPLATIDEAIRRVKPGGQVLITGYGTRLAYPGTEDRCITLRGEPGKPITLQRNVYTNTLYPTVLTSTRLVRGPWKLVEETSETRTFAAPWPRRIRLSGDADDGFVKLGGITLVGFGSKPEAVVRNAAWWADGQVFIRSDHYDPNDFDIFVKAGDGICVSGRSAHVRINDLMIVGAVHAIRVEPGAVDVKVSHLVRQNVLDRDLIEGGK